MKANKTKPTPIQRMARRHRDLTIKSSKVGLSEQEKEEYKAITIRLQRIQKPISESGEKPFEMQGRLLRQAAVWERTARSMADVIEKFQTVVSESAQEDGTFQSEDLTELHEVLSSGGDLMEWYMKSVEGSVAPVVPGEEPSGSSPDSHEEVIGGGGPKTGLPPTPSEG